MQKFVISDVKVYSDNPVSDKDKSVLVEMVNSVFTERKHLDIVLVKRIADFITAARAPKPENPHEVIKHIDINTSLREFTDRSDALLEKLKILDYRGFDSMSEETFVWMTDILDSIFYVKIGYMAIGSKLSVRRNGVENAGVSEASSPAETPDWSEPVEKIDKPRPQRVRKISHDVGRQGFMSRLKPKFLGYAAGGVGLVVLLAFIAAPSASGPGHVLPLAPPHPSQPVALSSAPPGIGMPSLVHQEAGLGLRQMRSAAVTDKPVPGALNVPPLSHPQFFPAGPVHPAGK